MQYLWSFLVGGLFCAVAQVFIDKTMLTPARILVAYVTSGVFLTAVGLYEPLKEFAGAGATVPLTGFGYSLAKGVEKAVDERAQRCGIVVNAAQQNALAAEDDSREGKALQCLRCFPGNFVRVVDVYTHPNGTVFF